MLIPTAVALGFPRQQVELILAHELGHLRRYDHLVNLAQAVIETLLFYHPAVHWISREVRNDREVCCDRLVLRLTARRAARIRADARIARRTSPRHAAPRDRRDGRRPARSRAPHHRHAGAAARRAASDARPDAADRGRRAASRASACCGRTARISTRSPPARMRCSSKLPRPDAAMLVGIALREPPKWNVTLSTPKLAPIAEPAAHGRVEARSARSRRRAASAGDSAEPMSLKPIRSLGPVADVAQGAGIDDADREPCCRRFPRRPARLVRVGTSTARARHLVPVHVISPRYPDNREVKEPVRVDVQFGLNADGSVRDVAAVADDATNAAFGASAEKAMREWRFDAVLGARRSRRRASSSRSCSPSRATSPASRQGRQRRGIRLRAPDRLAGLPASAGGRGRACR